MSDPEKPLEIVYLQIADIKPWAKNPRFNELAVDDVANSIEEFGMIVPIIVNKDLEVKAGHTRLLACKKKGLTTIPAIIIEHLNEEQQAAFAIADNKTASLATWDDAKLKIIFEDLKAANYDVLKTGFQTTEVESILNGWESDIKIVEKTMANTDGIVGKITVSCPMEMKEELKQFIISRIGEQGFEGVEIE